MINDMDSAVINTENGNINISRMAIEALIYMILKDVKGILWPEKIGLKRITHHMRKALQSQSEGISQRIKIEIKPDAIIIANLFLIISYGLRIPDLTWEIQAKIKEKVKEVTGLEINKINVHIQGIHYPRKNRNENQLAAQEIFLKVF